jgi:hypothetical protein
VVSSSPPARAGLLLAAYRVVKAALGVPAGSGRGDQLPSDPGSFDVAVGRDAGLDVPQVAGHRLAGTAELIDPVGEGIISTNAAGDHVGPVMIDMGT